VDEYLRVPGHSNVFVLGDSALCLDAKSGKPLPPLARSAFQQGDHMAKTLTNLLRGVPITPFKYFQFWGVGLGR